MRDFFERQLIARRRTRRLLFLFALTMALIVVAVYLAVSFLLCLYTSLRFPDVNSTWALWQPERFSLVASLTLLAIGGGSWYKMRQLRAGGRKVAQILNARLISPGTAEERERRLLNVVEEMALAAGMAVPAAYILDRETGINAFAAGFGLDDAVICVTAGALDLLGRDELQGVIAHEFSHLLRRDTELNTRLLGWLHGLLLIGLTGQALLRQLRNLSLGSARIALPAIFLGSALYLLGAIGLFFGRLIKGAVSRQQEYHSDAAAVQFTRHPAGLAGALKKVGGITFGSVIANPRVAELSHMYFCDGVPGGHFFLFATHPPLADRIRRLEPGFDGVFPQPLRAQPPASEAPASKAPMAPRSHAIDAALPMSGAAALAILESVGAPMRQHAQRARTLLAEMAPELRLATRSPFAARALIYALLLDRRREVRERQLAALRQEEAGTVAEVERLTRLGPFSVQLRLPLLDLALPALRTQSKEEFQRFSRVSELLVQADGRLSPFEYALRRRLRRHLALHFAPSRPPVAQIYSVRGVRTAAGRVLSLLAHAGNGTADTARTAFERGAAVLIGPGVDLPFLAAGDCTFTALDEALAELERVSPLLKRKLLAACLECLMADGHIALTEAELFRAIADALGCPVPPWLEVQEEPAAV